MPLLEIDNLSVTFKTAGGEFTAVDRVSLNIEPGEIVSIVGESGSGKSVSMLALMGLLPWTATITADTLRFDGEDLKTINKERAPQDHRLANGDDLSGTDDQPQSLFYRRLSIDGSTENPPRHEPGREEKTGH